MHCLTALSIFLICGGSSFAVMAEELNYSSRYARQFEAASENRSEIVKALESCPDAQRASMEFLIEHMPKQDLRSLSADFLLENVRLAHEAKKNSPWEIPEAIFLNNVLPYANIDETRETWRQSMRERAVKIVAGCKTPGEAALLLNEKLFQQIGVQYSTKRRKANQSPSESIEQGLASCTGLSILLVDACRSVNVPARLVGVPSWTTKRGNHTWVEVWDGETWRFTGAAEYDPRGLDYGWFVNDASKADKSSKLHSIYAMSFKKTDTTFPTVWRGRETICAINVTDRYTANLQTPQVNMTEVRIQALSKRTGERVSTRIKVCLAENTSEQCAAGTSAGETDDTNNFLTFNLQRGKQYKVAAVGATDEVVFTTDGETQLVSLTVADTEDDEDTNEELSKTEAAELVSRLYKQRIESLREERQEEWEAKLITLGDLEMKFDYRIFGDEPEDGHSLFISMHGGGGAPARVNDQQWKNQIGLYEPKEGVYLAPRAPTDTWNLWHQSHIDEFFNRIIEDAIALEGINPNRVYIMGYSAGGDGVYQLAPRMADQLAAAAMMAGHPNGVSPLGLRNIGFTLHMGGQDSAYKRNEIAAEWKEKLAQLQAEDPEGYVHEVVIYPEYGHWMQRKDAVAVEWMSEFTRTPLPQKVVWHQTGVTQSQFYWLAANTSDQVTSAKMVVSRDGNQFTIHDTEKVSEVIIRLNDDMVDFDSPVTVKLGGLTQEFENLKRSRELIQQTLLERSDPNSVFSAEIRVPVDRNPAN
ncbi:MAG: transglutaminase domain-containing protein [Pirellulaceae bacterium]